MGEVGELAQLGERLPCTQEVTGSIPVFSTSWAAETGAAQLLEVEAERLKKSR